MVRRAVLLGVAGAAAIAPLSWSQVVAIENVNVIPMDRNRVIENQTVIIREGRIAEMGPAGRVRAPGGAARVEAKGKYLMPGLAEMHGHLPSPDSPRDLVEHILYLYIANGVTTVRGMLGNPEALKHRDDVAAGRLLGPRLYVAGPGFSGGAAKTAEIGEKMVREQKAAGYDLLKIQEGLRPEVYQAIVKTAKEVKIDFAGHVPDDVGVLGVIAAKQRSIDHLDNYIQAIEAGDSPAKNADAATRAQQAPFHVDERKIAEVARLTKRAGVWNIPTMALWEIFHNSETGEALRERLPEVRYMPKSTVDQWVARKNTMLRPSTVFMGFGVGGRTGDRVIELRKRLLKGLRDAGARIALGTDSPQMFSVPGFSIHREMKAMVESGMTAFEVLQGGTSRVAEYFAKPGEAGTVARGQRADLILLEANPLNDVANVARRAGVVVHGRWIPESEIQAKLKQMEAAAERM